jgi:hypothetical protein
LVAQARHQPVLFLAACLPAGTTVSATVAAGGQIEISSTGWKAGSDVSAELHSDPVDLGTLTAASSGRIAGSLTVPAAVPPGGHELVLTGIDATGLPRTIRAPVTVTAPGAATTTTALGSTAGGTAAGGLPRTGSSAIALVVWSVLLLVCGRMAVLLGRPPQVLPPLR